MKRFCFAAFKRDDLVQMVRHELNEDLDEIAGNDKLRTVVFNLIEWAEKSDRLGELINGAVAENPTNAELQMLATAFGERQTPPAFDVVAPKDKLAPDVGDSKIQPTPDLVAPKNAPAPDASPTLQEPKHRHQWLRWGMLAAGVIIIVTVGIVFSQGVFDPIIPSTTSSNASTAATTGRPVTPTPVAAPAFPVTPTVEPPSVVKLPQVVAIAPSATATDRPTATPPTAATTASPVPTLTATSSPAPSPTIEITSALTLPVPMDSDLVSEVGRGNEATCGAFLPAADQAASTAFKVEYQLQGSNDFCSYTNQRAARL